MPIDRSIFPESWNTSVGLGDEEYTAVQRLGHSGRQKVLSAGILLRNGLEEG